LGVIEKRNYLIWRNRGGLDSFQVVSWINLESLEKAVFPFASLDGLEYLNINGTAPPRGFLVL